ncbi:MAG TPA: hypothetical protein VFY87_31235 [Geminicoccaceae bacterium]|nr:hypothetical protein [Geminicoccaceae bacterium]
MDSSEARLPTERAAHQTAEIARQLIHDVHLQEGVAVRLGRCYG